MATYFKHLIDYPLDAVAYAVDKAIKTEEQLPVIKTLRELANSYRPPSKRQPITDAPQIEEFSQEQVEEAKRKVKEMIGSIGVNNAT